MQMHTGHVVNNLEDTFHENANLGSARNIPSTREWRPSDHVRDRRHSDRRHGTVRVCDAPLSGPYCSRCGERTLEPEALTLRHFMVRA